MNVYQYAYGQPLSYFDDTGEFVFIPALLGGGIAAFTDLGFQLLMNRGDWNCINWMQVGLSGMAGAIGGAWVGGAFRHSVSNLNWFRASHRWGRFEQDMGRSIIYQKVKMFIIGLYSRRAYCKKNSQVL